MSVYIEAKQGEIADKILLPGDPLRAKFIAENFLEDAKCYNNVRGMLGYTGTYKGERVSVQDFGMGMHLLLLVFYAQRTDPILWREKIDSCGNPAARSIQDVHVRDLIIAQGAVTSSSMVKKHFPDFHFAPIADFDLMMKSYKVAMEKGSTTHVGNVLSEDTFYKDDLAPTFKLAEYGVLGVETEAVILYYLGAKFHVQALGIMTVSDHMVTGEETTSEERQNTFKEYDVCGAWKR
ncbi:MAG: DeoD-type purine-nucleoside phosphorylase [Enterococcus raffinosus]